MGALRALGALRDALRLVIRSRFWEAAEALLPRVDSVCDAGRLRSLLEALGRAERFEDFRAVLEAS